MLSLERNGFTAEQVRQALHAVGGTREVRFRYLLMDKDDRVIGELEENEVINTPSIAFASFGEIKRTATFTLKDNANINYASDQIQPWMDVRVNGGWAQFPLGIFLLSSPERTEESGVILRDIEAYDKLVILRDDKFDDFYTVPAGVSYYSAIINILTSAGITKYNIENTDLIVPIDVVFEIGTSKLSAVNRLLTQINYNQIRVDVNGFFITNKYISPNDRHKEHTYQDDELSVLHNGLSESIDLFEVPNHWVVVVSNAEQDPLISSYTNENPDSVTSTVRRGRRITDFRSIDTIANQTALDGYVARLAMEASQVYGRLSFSTALMPHHEYFDMLEINYSPLSIAGVFTETNWKMDLVAGGKMTHEVRKLVIV